MPISPISFGSSSQVTEQEELNYLYKTMTPDNSKKLRVADEKRVISVYRGEDYLNKITIRPADKTRLVRTMVNIGTKDNPELVTSRIHFRTGIGILDVFVDKYIYPGVKEGIHLDAYLLGPDAHFQKPYKDFQAMRADKKFWKVLEVLTKRKLL